VACILGKIWYHLHLFFIHFTSEPIKIYWNHCKLILLNCPPQERHPSYKVTFFIAERVALKQGRPLYHHPKIFHHHKAIFIRICKQQDTIFQK
jgi:hypothetical protein